MTDFKSQDQAHRSEKPKRRFRRHFFNLAPIFLILLIFQIFVLFEISTVFTGFIEAFYAFFQLANFFLAVHIVNRDQNPGYKITWLVVMFLFPPAGALFYLYVRTSPFTGKIVDRIRKRMEHTRHLMRSSEEVEAYLEDQGSDYKGLAHYLETHGVYPAYQNTALDYYPEGASGFEAILEAIGQAEKFIFLEYFIIKPGELLDHLLDLLEKKVSQGVEVRFLYDGMNKSINVPWSFNLELQDLGIKTRVFSPLVPIFMTYQNNRDHRKILVIDGKVGFVGGVNLADEYTNIIEVYGHWKDNVLRIEGEAVRSLTNQFLLLWNFDQEINEDVTDYLDQCSATPRSQGLKGLVVPYTDIPEDDEGIGETIYMDMIYRAKDRIQIMTPYLILDHEMIMALIYAAKRGVHVTIYMPHIPDKPYAFYLAQTYYPQLIKGGVEIREYIPGFLHSKTFLVDGKEATVGSVNLDYRSLYLNYENGCWFTDSPALEEIAKDFQYLEENSLVISLDYLKSRPLWQRISGRALRLLAPLM